MKQITVKIELNEADIAEGVARDCELCPVAIAVRRETGGDGIKVGVYGVQFIKDGKLFSAAIPNIAKTFIERFDDGEAVVPFNCELVFDVVEL